MLPSNSTVASKYHNKKSAIVTTLRATYVCYVMYLFGSVRRDHDLCIQQNVRLFENQIYPILDLKEIFGIGGLIRRNFGI